MAIGSPSRHPRQVDDERYTESGSDPGTLGADYPPAGRPRHFEVDRGAGDDDDPRSLVQPRDRRGRRGLRRLVARVGRRVEPGLRTYLPLGISGDRLQGPRPPAGGDGVGGLAHLVLQELPLRDPRLAVGAVYMPPRRTAGREALPGALPERGPGTEAGRR